MPYCQLLVTKEVNLQSKSNNNDNEHMTKLKGRMVRKESK